MSSNMQGPLSPTAKDALTPLVACDRTHGCRRWRQSQEAEPTVMGMFDSRSQVLVLAFQVNMSLMQPQLKPVPGAGTSVQVPLL